MLLCDVPQRGLLIRLDSYVPFTMGPLLTLVLSFMFAIVWDRLVTDWVTGRLKRTH